MSTHSGVQQPNETISSAKSKLLLLSTSHQPSFSRPPAVNSSNSIFAMSTLQQGEFNFWKVITSCRSRMLAQGTYHNRLPSIVPRCMSVALHFHHPVRANYMGVQLDALITSSIHISTSRKLLPFRSFGKLSSIKLPGSVTALLSPRTSERTCSLSIFT